MIAGVRSLLWRLGGGGRATGIPTRAAPVKMTDPAEKRDWWRWFATLEQRLTILEAEARAKRRGAP